MTGHDGEIWLWRGSYYRIEGKWSPNTHLMRQVVEKDGEWRDAGCVPTIWGETNFTGAERVEDAEG